MRPLKTLQIFEPGCDGVFRHVEKLTHYLHGRGVEVDLAYSSVRPSPGLFKFIDEVRLQEGRAVDLAIGPAPRPRDITAAVALIKLCQKNEYDLVHAHSSKAGALARVFRPFLNTPAVFYTPHAYYGLGAKSGLSSWAYNSVESLLSKIGTTINVSNDEADFGRHHLHVPIENRRIVPNPVDCQHFRPATANERTESRKLFGIPEQAEVVAYAGRFSYQKDPLTAFEAFARCARGQPARHLVYLCKESLRMPAEKYFREANLTSRVTFLDHQEDVLPFYHCADLFLLTSRYEAGWPFVILEAMACGLPLVTSICPGMSDIQEAGLSHCWTFPVGSVNDCADAISNGLKPRLEKASNHRSIAENRFSVEACFGAVHRLYQQASLRAKALEAPSIA